MRSRWACQLLLWWRTYYLSITVPSYAPTLLAAAWTLVWLAATELIKVPSLSFATGIKLQGPLGQHVCWLCLVLSSLLVQRAVPGIWRLQIMNILFHTPDQHEPIDRGCKIQRAFPVMCVLWLKKDHYRARDATTWCCIVAGLCEDYVCFCGI